MLSLSYELRLSLSAVSMEWWGCCVVIPAHMQACTQHTKDEETSYTTLIGCMSCMGECTLINMMN